MWTRFYFPKNLSIDRLVQERRNSIAISGPHGWTVGILLLGVLWGKSTPLRYFTAPDKTQRCSWFPIDIDSKWHGMLLCPTNNSFLLRRKDTITFVASWLMWCQNILAIHWKRNVILMKFSSLAVLEVVILTTSSAASDENFINMTFPFQWISCN